MLIGPPHLSCLTYIATYKVRLREVAKGVQTLGPHNPQLKFLATNLLHHTCVQKEGFEAPYM